ncbi:autotransporter outer membrane beta-barrel domain-containing protein [Azonexus sp.]|uniref:autotransporter outer membrane beta-barrel domain-containing protein n=1 Tax=Azonexus sp. TaxID=1872668 RepID=UPI00282C6967|nr:autotransporter outer membrane beta-barrel domain-containing protein [Azonexus sp.]MDR1994802.1 autotransporter domain-containing protein [Azonexus sp.]
MPILWDSATFYFTPIKHISGDLSMKHAPRRTVLYLLMASSLGFGLLALPVPQAAAEIIISGIEVGPFDGNLDTGSASGNTLTITGSVIRAVVGVPGTGEAHGGAAGMGTAENAAGNTVNVSGSVEDGVRGGFILSGGTGNATGNTVNISGGSVGEDVIGGSVFGFGSPGSATGNTVNISGGSVGQSVLGGSVGDTGNATGNTVNISGGSVNGGVFGGLSNTGNATGNSVTISGTPTLAGSTLYGGYSFGGGDAFTGNTLNVKNAGMTVGGVQNFQNINFTFPVAQTTPVLTVTGGAVLGNGAGVGTTVTANTMSGAAPLAPGAAVTLIDGPITGDLASTQATGKYGATLSYDWTLTQTASSLDATLDKVQAVPEAKALLEGRLAGLAFVQDSLIHRNIRFIKGMKPDAGTSNVRSFVLGEAASTRYDTGSHVDVDGGSIMAGVSWTNAISSGTMMLGGFFEAGWGSYDTFNGFSSAPSVKGSGDTKYYGVGIFGRHDFNSNGPGNAYTEGSLRIGHVDTDFDTADLGGSGKVKYDSGSTYYGLHLGAGYLWKVRDNATVDLSAKYMWTRMGSDSVTLNTGDPVKFKAAGSHRIRAGGRFTFEATEVVSPYFGAYYDYEFDGKARGSSYGFGIDAPSLKGGTGIGEFGLTIKPCKSRPLYLDLGIQGYLGTREGVTGSFQLRYQF